MPGINLPLSLVLGSLAAFKRLKRFNILSIYKKSTTFENHLRLGRVGVCALLLFGLVHLVQHHLDARFPSRKFHSTINTVQFCSMIDHAGFYLIISTGLKIAILVNSTEQKGHIAAQL